MLALGIGAHNQEIRAGLKLAMSCPSRQQRDVAGLEHQLVATLAAQHQPPRSSGKTQHLMRGRVIVMKIVDSVPPLRWPAIALESRLHRRGHVPARREHAPIQQNGKFFVIGHPAILVKLQSLNPALGCKHLSSHSRSQQSQTLAEGTPIHVLTPSIH